MGQMGQYKEGDGAIQGGRWGMAELTYLNVDSHPKTAENARFVNIIYRIAEYRQ
jgi:hypothetical protein